MDKKIIVAGHICIDITPVFPKICSYSDIREILAPGKLIQMEQADVHMGGCVGNTGLALKILGADVQLMGKIGDDTFGKMIQQIFNQYNAEELIVDDKSSTSYSVVIAIPGVDRILLHNSGANDTFSNLDIQQKNLENAVMFHFGYPPLMKKMYENEGQNLIEIFQRMKKKGIATSLDFAAVDPNSEANGADWHLILKKVLPFVDFFVPSFEELCFILDREKYDRLAASGGNMTTVISMEDDVKPLANELMHLGCKIVLIKCGMSGIYYRTAEKSVLKKVGNRLELDVDMWEKKEGIQPCFQVDTVLSGAGAGDTCIAAYLAAVLRGNSPESCVALAAAEGACCVTTYDALSGLKSLDELETKISAGWKTKEE